ncbi:glycoside hydrolase family 64 protein [Tautonia marina]|uniref:glycoside hydrolase family 64 protein n=1 Tax=Tautonia marina TaxID=2653855 RepID=UPI0012610CAE|nr:glycoside hydrolase family 64 protein [Tautonia marina]
MRNRRRRNPLSLLPRPSCEPLEARTLLSTVPALFHRFGTVEAPQQRASVPLPLTADRVDPGPSDRIVYQIEVRPLDDSPFMPGQVQIRRGSGPAVVPHQIRSGETITAFVPLRPGDFSLTVSGQGESTGAFVVSVGLAGDVSGDFDVDPEDFLQAASAFRSRPIPGTAQATSAASRAQLLRTGLMAWRNQGAEATPFVTFRFENLTAPGRDPHGTPAYTNASIHVAITAKDASGTFVRVDSNGSTTAMALSDNTAAGHLTKNKIDYSNYFHTIDQFASGWDVPYQLQGARLWIGMGSPLYLKVNHDAAGNIGYAGPDFGNPTDPNLNLYVDWIEFSTMNSGFNGNTTQVDQFGVPLKLTLSQTGQSDQTVGLETSRSTLFQKYAQDVDSAFQSLRTAQAPYRILAPKHGIYSQANNPIYFDTYIDSVWTSFQTTTWEFQNVLGTFTGTVSPQTQVLTLHPKGNPQGPTYTIQKPKTWEIFAAAGNMATGNAIEKAIQAQIVAGFTRHVAAQNPAINVPPFTQTSSFYAQSPANFYSQFWHQYGLDGLAYGFDYDDVYGQNPTVTGSSSHSPQVTVTLGWD